MKLQITFLLFFFHTVSLLSQKPVVQWKEYFGGLNDDAFFSVIRTGGSYAASGVFKNINNVSQSWVVSISVDGIDYWQKKYRWEQKNLVTDVAMNTDYSYMVVGFTYERRTYRRDLYYMRLSSRGGKIGRQIVGGKYKDGATDVIALPDGGNIIYGYFSNEDDQDLWLLRINEHNTEIWEKKYNFSKFDEPVTCELTHNNDIIFSANTYSKNNLWDVCFNVVDFENGIEKNNFSIGNEFSNWANDMIFSFDSTIVVCGYTVSPKNAKDFWITKIDINGNIIWEKIFGWSMNEEANAIYQKIDGNYAVCGYTESKGSGMYDFWIMEIDNNGNLLWEKTIGTDANDVAYDITEADDGGLIVVGSAFNDQKKLDGCIIKLK